MSFQLNVRVCSGERARYELTTALLIEHLQDLVNWRPFAIFLEGITPTDINIIISDNPCNVVNQRIALYNRWLKKCPNPSWDHVITALDKAREHALAQRIREYKETIHKRKAISADDVTVGVNHSNEPDDRRDPLNTSSDKLTSHSSSPKKNCQDFRRPEDRICKPQNSVSTTQYTLRDKAKTSSLYIASKKGHLEVVKTLLQNKINPDTPMHDEHGATPIFIASFHGHLQVVELLLQAKANPHMQLHNDGSGATPLFAACHNGHLAVVERLLQEQVNPNTPIDNGATPLLESIYHNHLQIVDRLLQAKANPNTLTKDGVTPLYIASANGHLEIVKRLLQAKASLHTPESNTGKTPLLTASEEGHSEVVEQLLLAKAHPDIPMNNGKTPLYIACQKGHLEVVEKLLQAKADPNIQADDGTTPLHIAKKERHSVIVERLLLSGAKCFV